MAKNISPGRQVAFYVGTGLIVIGLLTFLSFFLSAMTSRPGPDRDSSMMARPLVGIILMALGQGIRALGERGLAGSGLVLAPKRSRSDLEPHSRMVGGMIKDALDEAELLKARQPERVIMIKCQSCGTLNQETAKFCQECGTKFPSA